MAEKLTIKQEKFCQQYHKTGNASEAYRRAYDAKNSTPNSVNRMANALLNNLKIASRVKELQNKAEKRHEITVDDLIGELEQARTIALGAETPQASAAVSATMGKGKLLGLVVDKVDSKVKSTNVNVDVAQIDPAEAARAYKHLMG